MADRRQEGPSRFGRRLTRTCRQSSRACSRSSATWLRPRWGSLPASAARCCCSWPPSSLPESSWPSASRAPAGVRSIFDRIVGTAHGEEFARLSTATIRAVALGVLGVAFIQAIVVGSLLMIAGVPFAGLLALIVLVLGIAQVPALLVTLPAIVYIWMSGDYGTVAAVTHTVLLFLARHARQRTETAAAGSRCRCADARHPAGRIGRPGRRAASWECSSARPCWPSAIRSSCGGWRPILIPQRRRRSVAASCRLSRLSMSMRSLGRTGGGAGRGYAPQRLHDGGARLQAAWRPRLAGQLDRRFPRIARRRPADTTTQRAAAAMVAQASMIRCSSNSSPKRSA